MPQKHARRRLSYAPGHLAGQRRLALVKVRGLPPATRPRKARAPRGTRGPARAAAARSAPLSQMRDGLAPFAVLSPARA
eukprot:15452573-Alexandrium_andersonii.AAC.1